MTEMAIMGADLGRRHALGVACFAAEPGTTRAKFAIGTRSDWYRRGAEHDLRSRAWSALRALEA